MSKEWTEGRRNAFITSVLRGGMRKYPAKWEALEAAYQGTQVNKATGRLAKHYQCRACGNLFTSKDVECDHITPVVDPVKGFTTWDDFINRLYCDKYNLQILCKSCHKIKTSSERVSRVSAKKASRKGSAIPTSKKQPSTTPLVPLKNSAKKIASKSGINSPRTRKPT